MTSFIIAVICSLVVYYRDDVSGGVAGLILSYSLLVCEFVSWMILVAIDVEKAVVAAERAEEYSKIASEAPWQVDDGPVLDENWPNHGKISLVDYSTKYRFVCQIK